MPYAQFEGPRSRSTDGIVIPLNSINFVELLGRLSRALRGAGHCARLQRYLLGRRSETGIEKTLALAPLPLERHYLIRNVDHWLCHGD